MPSGTKLNSNGVDCPKDLSCNTLVVTGSRSLVLERLVQIPLKKSLAGKPMRRQYHFRSWIALGILALFGACSICRATTFYVDAATGDDSRSGTSLELAWSSLKNIKEHKFQPGDQILLRAGQTWTGSIEPRGSGTPESPILLASYGQGTKPLIKGDGAPATIRLSEVSYWTIRDISVINHGAKVDVRNGIMVHVAFAGIVAGIRLENVDVSDVNGEVRSKSSGGIGFLAWRKKGNAARFDGILIDHCTVKHVDGQGIWFHTKGNLDSNAETDAQGESEFPNTNVRITGNTIMDAGRNAIFLRSALEAVIDHNVIRFAAARTHGNAVVVVGSKGTVIRENEVANTGENTGEGENGAFDADIGAIGTVIEYNWSHDNAGGMTNIVNDPTHGTQNRDTVVRYNLSENDKARVFGIGGSVSNTLIYNNTVFIGRGRSPDIIQAGRFVAHKPGTPDGIGFVNNVIYSEGGGDYVLDASDVAFDSNCLFGKRSVRDLRDRHKETGDPGFDRGAIPIKSWTELAHYRVSPTSGCANPGFRLPNNGGRDILGSVLVSEKALDRGAVASGAK